MSYSNGGTLTLPSPTHVRSGDLSSGLRSLRHSLSRSPSSFRFTTKSPSQSPQKSPTPAPHSSPKRVASQPQLFAAASQQPPHTPSPLVPGVKLALRSCARSKTAPTRPLLRRTSPKSPMKRALSQSSDSGNVPPTPSKSLSAGQENSRSTSPAERKSFERLSRVPFNLEGAAPVNPALSRLGGDGSNDMHLTPHMSSPLKRSDAIMNLDQASLGSPAAKRRSLHGSASFGHDFNVFDHGPTSTPQFDIHDDSTQEYELSAAPLGSDGLGSSLASMPRRSSSLRKSTLQQRHDDKKSSWGRRHAAQQLAQQLASAGAGAEVFTPNPSKNRPRLSLDQFMPPLARDSPFTSGALPNASVHVINQASHQPHPLSRTMTTSSSGSSVADDSPTHVPVHHAQNPRSKLDFSKSLPVGSMRPYSSGTTSTSNGFGSFNTPQNYKSAKPEAAAFASTGLISKVNRHPEEPQIYRGISTANMPDTPCKKHINPFSTHPSAFTGSVLSSAKNVRHSFGTPSTPFGSNQSSAGMFGKGNGVFGSSFGGLRGANRRGSILNLDGDDSGGSPEPKSDSQSSGDFELPPTPTKHPLASGGLAQLYDSCSPTSHRSVHVSTSAMGHGLNKPIPRTSSKLNLTTSPDDGGGDEDDGDVDDSDGSMDIDSPTTSIVRLYVRPATSVPSFGRSRALRGSHPHSPTPILPKSLTTPFMSPSSKPGFAKISRVAPASPMERIGFYERLIPRTPQDSSILPPDPSGLSISNPRDKKAVKLDGNNASMLPPATPTAERDYFSNKRFSTTPIGPSAAPDIDRALTSRFEKVKLIGEGVFSLVYRVTQAPAPAYTTLSPSQQSKTPPTPIPERVFAIKKLRQPYQGTRDRERKLQEVRVLRALGQSDHVVRLIADWEENDHLYIQTEFCEEGSLDKFLADVGGRARLDDFRIWKIMLELCQGLKHIHESGFIHLDLKPANIFISFEGVLKIGDFGLATSWPAPTGIELEGDRQYIGPEILTGKFDQPADIFALGLIFIEVAGNVQLPQNGETWQKLRSADWSEVPSLTWSDDSCLQRDATGMPVGDSDISMGTTPDEELEPHFGSPTLLSRKNHARASFKESSHNAGNLFGSLRRGELHHAPDFMRHRDHQDALENIIQWMTKPLPKDRPLIQEVLRSGGLRWVQKRRRAGATVFEGNWGPADDVLADDAEMILPEDSTTALTDDAEMTDV